MGIWDTYQYDIREKLPEWWKEDIFLEPINRYSQQLMKKLVGGLLSNIGIVQPVQVWKTLPTEYSWTHTYTNFDDKLLNEQDSPALLQLRPNKPQHSALRRYILCPCGYYTPVGGSRRRRYHPWKGRHRSEC